MDAFDVVVVGGGPAGMMAAVRAAQYGAKTTLIEKNDELGKKLLLTGRGRCNYAHDEPDPSQLVTAYGSNGQFLLPAMKQFGLNKTLDFFMRRGIVPAHERGHRIYPVLGQDSMGIVNALWGALKDGHVVVIRKVEVRGIDVFGGKARRLLTPLGEIGGNTFIIATGGLSFPETGSTGNGFNWARKAGLKVTELRPAICPIKVRERLSESTYGFKLKNVRLKAMQGDTLLAERFGEMDLTPFGVSGAIAMDLASTIGPHLHDSVPVTLHIDLKSALDPERLDARIDRDFEQFSGDPLRFAMRKLLPSELIPDVLSAAGLYLGQPCQETTQEERKALRQTMKDFTLTASELLGFDYAIVTAGGIDLDEIDPETMASKKIPNLYFAGEMLDLDGPTGGYNLQECWTTGYAAGSAAARSLGFAEPTDQQILEQMEDSRISQLAYDRACKARREEQEAMSALDKEHRDSGDFTGWKDPRRDVPNENIIESEEQPADEKVIEPGDDEVAEEASDLDDNDGEKTVETKEEAAEDDLEGGKEESSLAGPSKETDNFDELTDSGTVDDDEQPNGEEEGQKNSESAPEGRPYYGRGDRSDHGDRPFHSDRSYNRDDRGGERRSFGDRPFHSDRPYNRDDRGGERRSFGDRPFHSDRPYNRDDRGGERRSFGDRPFHSDRPYNRDDRGGERRSFGDRPFHGDRPYNRDDRGGERRSFGDRPFHSDRPYNRDDRGGERRSFGDRPFHSDRPYNRDDRGGEHRSFGDRPFHSDRPYNRDDRGGERRSFGDRPFHSDRPYNRDDRGGERRSFGDRPFHSDRPYNRDDRGGEHRSFGDRPFHSDRPYNRDDRGGEHRSFGDRPFHSDRPYNRDDRGGERRSFGDRPYRPNRDDRPHGGRPGFGGPRNHDDE